VFVENRIAYKTLPSAIGESFSAYSGQQSYSEYLKSEALIIGLSGSDIQGADDTKLVEMLVAHYGADSREYFDVLSTTPSYLSGDGVDVFFGNLYEKSRKVFSRIHTGFHRGSYEYLTEDFLKNVLARKLLVSYTELMAFDSAGNYRKTLDNNVVVRPTGALLRAEVSGRGVMLAEVETQTGDAYFVPLLGFVSLGVENFLTLQQLKGPRIKADLDLASFLHVSSTTDDSTMVTQRGGLGVREDLQARSGAQMRLNLGMTMRDADGSELSQLDEGAEVTFTGGTQIFIVNGLPVVYFEISVETEGGVNTGFVFSMGMSFVKTIRDALFVDSKFSHEVYSYPSSQEVDRLKFDNLKVVLPTHLKKSGLIVGLNEVTHEYFIFSKRHTLNFGGKTLRYLRYKQDYLDENYQKEFANYLTKHGDVVGFYNMKFEFESLDDLSVCSFFDTDMVKTLNDLLDEAESDEKQKMLVGMVNNNVLRFYNPKPAMKISKVDILKQARDYQLVHVVKHDGGFMELECEYIGEEKSLLGSKKTFKALHT